MNTATLAARGFTLKQVLVVDALTCVITGLMLLIATTFVATLSGFPESLVRYAGLLLLPCGALMVVAARTLARPLVWLIVLGNLAWVGASIFVAVALAPTAIGFTLTLVQAAAVAFLAMLEWQALR